MSLFPSLQKGVDKLKENNQLWFTLLFAILIVLAFIFVSNRFLTIAQDAQNRLLKERMGAFQDSFVQFVPKYLQDTGDLNLNSENYKSLKDIITKITLVNPTISEFKIVKFVDSKPLIVASINSSEIGKIDDDFTNNFLYNLSRSDPNQSNLSQQNTDTERYNIASRIIVDNHGNEIGAVLVKQSLTEADIKISQGIRQSVVVFIFIVILIMILFFRHSRIIDYVSLYKKLQSVDQLKDEFISMASHELRTPLTIIRGYVENFRDAGPLNEQQKLSADRIEISAKQLDDLVNDMLDVSRLQQGRLKLEMVEINPVDFAKPIVDGLLIVAQEKGLDLKIENKLTDSSAASDVASVNASAVASSASSALAQDFKIKVDKDRFRQVLVNVVGNAIKYTIKGEIKVIFEKVNNKLSIRVSDTGIGMTKEDQEKLFEKFYRIKSKETLEIRGTGLGLWITKQMVEQMGGKIDVESIKGVGTHFVLHFPLI